MHRPQIHRPLKQEHPQQAEPLTGTKTSRPAPFFKRRPEREQVSFKIVPAVQLQAQALLRRACRLIGDSQPEEALSNQSKAMELANQYIDSGIGNIRDIQDILYRIKHTLTTGRFTCEQPDDFSNVIILGDAFRQLSMEQQLTNLLIEAIRSSALPAGKERPAGGHEPSDPAAAWANYIVALCQLLPERPYLITGTPTGGKDREEEDNDGGVVRRSGRTPSGIRRFFNIFFRQ